MELEHPLRDVGADVPALAVQDARQPEGLARPLDGIDVDIVPARIGDHEPDQPGSDHEPDDQQPPIEFGVHGSGV